MKVTKSLCSSFTSGGDESCYTENGHLGNLGNRESNDSRYTVSNYMGNMGNSAGTLDSIVEDFAEYEATYDSRYTARNYSMGGNSAGTLDSIVENFAENEAKDDSRCTVNNYIGNKGSTDSRYAVSNDYLEIEASRRTLFDATLKPNVGKGRKGDTAPMRALPATDGKRSGKGITVLGFFSWVKIQICCSQGCLSLPK